jgi:hypothetical protein
MKYVKKKLIKKYIFLLENINYKIIKNIYIFLLENINYKIIKNIYYSYSINI